MRPRTQPLHCLNHPIRSAYCKGLCKGCYEKSRLDSNPVARECQRARSREWYGRNRETEKHRTRSNEISKKYSHRRWDRFFGWEIGTHARLISSAKVCDMCSEPFGKNRSEWAHTDHCHEAGVFRGFIHNRCNAAIGCLNNREDLAMRAAEYIRRTKFWGGCLIGDSLRLNAPTGIFPWGKVQ